ncbi:MAG: hypothetical protein ACI835_002668 [Planctomycetota bacterium]|jgi:hypothetical protein
MNHGTGQLRPLRWYAPGALVLPSSTQEIEMKLQRLFHLFATIGAVLLTAQLSIAQSETTEAQREADIAARIAQLVEQIDQNTKVLETLEQDNATLELQRVRSEVKQDGEPEAVSIDLNSLGRRVEIIRYARDAFDRNGDLEAKEQLNLAIHYGELALGKGSDEALSQAAAKVPNKPILIDYLRKASSQYREWRRVERATACHQLAQYYAGQVETFGEQADIALADQLRAADERLRVEEEHKRAEEDRRRQIESGTSGNIASLAHRTEILQMAHGALARAGEEELANKMSQVLHVAHMQRDGADPEALTQAFEGKGLSLGLMIELLQKASGFYAGWDRVEQAQACNGLAEFYAARARGEEPGHDPEEEPAPDHDESSLEDLDRRIEILQLAHEGLTSGAREDMAHMMGRVIRVAEMQRAGAGEEELSQAMEGLSLGQTVTHLRMAAEIFAKRGERENAGAVSSLARFYNQRLKGEAEEEAFAPAEPEAERNLESRTERVEILRMGHDAHRRARHPEQAKMLQQTVLVGELQLAEQDPERIAEAAAGLTMEGVIDALVDASDLYRKWGRDGRAQDVQDLVNFYVQRDEVRSQEAQDDEELQSLMKERAQGREELHQMMQQIEVMQKELQRLSESIRSMMNDK